MSGHRIHLIVGHVPAVGVFIGIVLLAWGLASQSADVKRASLVVFVLSAAATAATVATGEAAKQAVWDLPGIDREAIERHARGGKLAAVPAYLLGVLSVIALFWGARFSVLWTSTVVLIVALFAAIMPVLASRAGGQIRHAEARPEVR
jgi:hypothetical protein